MATKLQTLSARLLALAIALLLADAFFLLAHTAAGLIQHYADSSVVFSDRWYLGTDQGYSEIFGYFKALAVATLLLLLLLYARRIGQPIFLAWSIAFYIIVADDALLLHERLGGLFADTWQLLPRYGLRAQDMGGLVTWSLIWTPMVVVLFVAHRRSDKLAQQRSLLLALILGVLAFFAVIVVMFHVVAAESSAIAGALLTIIEDGGELVTLTGALLVVIQWVVRETSDGMVGEVHASEVVRPESSRDS